MPERFEPLPDDSLKWCHDCGEKKPLSDYHADIASPDGRKNVCKECRARQHAEARASGMNPLITAAEEEGVAALEHLSRGGSFVPAMTEVVESLVRPFGGIDGLSKTVYAYYYACDPGSNRRFQVLKMIFEMIRANSAAGGATDPLDEFDDKDIRKIIADCIQQNPTIINHVLGNKADKKQAVLDVRPAAKPVHKEAAE